MACEWWDVCGCPQAVTKSAHSCILRAYKGWALFRAVADRKQLLRCVPSNGAPAPRSHFDRGVLKPPAVARTSSAEQAHCHCLSLLAAAAAAACLLLASASASAAACCAYWLAVLTVLAVLACLLLLLPLALAIPLTMCSFAGTARLRCAPSTSRQPRGSAGLAAPSSRRTAGSRASARRCAAQPELKLNILQPMCFVRAGVLTFLGPGVGVTAGFPAPDPGRGGCPVPARPCSGVSGRHAS